jgi:hypothetical protein
MRATLFVVLVALVARSVAAETVQLSGTWSGNWVPAGGAPEAVTIELKQDSGGKLTGKFLTPVAMDFGKVSFNAKTGILSAEAAGPSSKQYRLEGKVEGNEIKGKLVTGSASGEVHLIKWTFFPRPR